MICVTADTNIYISGLIFGGVPLHFLNQARLSAFKLTVSEPLLAETRRVLRDKFEWEPNRLDEAFARLARFTTLVHPTETIEAVPADPADDRIVECAIETRSDFIVTGDRRSLDLGSYRGVRMVRVADFMALLLP